MRRFSKLLATSVGTTDFLKQEQREAILDAMHYCMLVDGRPVIAEEDLIEEWTARLRWEGSVSLKDYVLESVAKARRARNEPEFHRAYVRDISVRLADATTRQRALRLCEKIVAADGRTLPVEMALVDELTRENRYDPAA